MVLPWHSALGPMGSLSTLDSTLDNMVPVGRRIPSAILQGEGLGALTNSDLWFLIIDGSIRRKDRLDFLNGITSAGLHGMSCITVIFDTKIEDISVGVSMFGLCPNSMVLFYNTDCKEIIILQTKGTFNSLLKGSENPVFVGSPLTWGAVPKFSVADLASVIIPSCTRLRKDQIQLQNSHVISYEDLLANKLRQEDVAAIFSDEENLRSVVLYAKSFLRVDEFQLWLQQQHIEMVDPL